MDELVQWRRERGAEADRWQLSIGPDEVLVNTAAGVVVLSGEDVARVQVRRGWFSARVLVDTAGMASPGSTSPSETSSSVSSSVSTTSTGPLRLRGLRRAAAGDVTAALTRVLARHHARPTVTAALDWHHLVTSEATQALTIGRWITTETRHRWADMRPGPAVRKGLAEAQPELSALFGDLELTAVKFLLQVDLEQWVGHLNEEILQSETTRHRHFFDTVESRPLSAEQIRAVVSFDNRVQVVAAAGSGKTSVMVARAAYGVLRGFVRPDRVLLLAFNKAAAAELQERVEKGFARAGLSAIGVRSQTFHSFGLSVLGQAYGRKPRPAEWSQGPGMVCRIVDELRDSSPAFAYRWDLFRLIYARAPQTNTAGEPDGWDAANRRPGFRTAAGDVVKSEGERLIADFLFFNGVDYDYEAPYSHDVADAEHSQYRPDFHYQTAGGELWHEHWALDAYGRAPETFTGYAESMDWKKDVHQFYGTTLIETTWAQVMHADGLAQLADSLRAHGLTLDWNPDRRSQNTPYAHEDLAGLIRQFISHVKANSWTTDDLERRLEKKIPLGGRGRARMFLDLFWQIYERWNARLAHEGSVDFDDMLVDAAGHLESGRVRSEYDLVLVDEFQDASQARARLTRALVAPAGRHLLAVGDDWQSINRFAGADLAVMTSFTDRFGHGPTLRLQTTFRSPQELCDTASSFVAKNPRQISKTVHSAQPDHGPRTRLIVAADRDQLHTELHAELTRLSQQVTLAPAPGTTGDAISSANGGATPNHQNHASTLKPVTVDVLGRYGFDKNYLTPEGEEPVQYPGLKVTFRTAHGSKGLEADYVILPNVTSGTRGFPCTIVDDPVLDLAMVDADGFQHAEERRLFYVALTRARRQVTLLTVSGRESPFITELLADDRLEVVASARAAVPPPVPCPRCGEGLLRQRHGKYGQFLSCSRYACSYTANHRRN